jgi:GntR family transcriptional regulator / MocR family aminotransferase
VDLFIDAAGGRGLSEQLYEQIRGAIAAGRLRAGDQLPPSRDAARRLGISRHTVTTAYGRLVAEGFVSGRAGGGSFVAGLPVPVSGPDPGAGTGPGSGTGPGAEGGAGPTAVRPALRFTGWAPAGGPLQPAEVRYDLRAGLADLRLFPAGAWHRQGKAALRPDGRPAATGDPAGEFGLRLTIARWIGRSRAVAAEADTVVVTSGAQHAVDLVARVVLEPGATVAVEDPGYLPVVRLLRSLGARVAGVPVDEQGLVVDQLPPAARIVYLTPSHQYPFGAVLSMARRRELLAWAARNDAAIVEDDYDSEFRHVDRPLEPIHRLDSSGRVIYVGSFSKVLSPELRLGFAVLPPSLAGPVTALRQLIDWHPPVMAQFTLAGLLEDGTVDRHLRRAGRIYTQRYQIVRAALAGPLSPWLSALPAQAGLHLTALLPAHCDEEKVQAAAAARGIATTGLSQYFHARPAQPGLVIGFGGIDAAVLPAALAELGDALDAVPGALLGDG